MWRAFVWAVLAVGAGFALCLGTARRLGGEAGLCGRAGRNLLFWGLCVGNGLLAGGLCAVRGESEAWVPAALGFAGGGLIFACLTDVRSGMVYDFVWWLVLGTAVFLLCHRPEEWRPVWGQLAVFLILQRFWFVRFYGRADVYAFCACGVIESAFGMGLREYLIQMAEAFFLLAAVQGARRNIGPDGNLKRPVPFLPYIVCSFWLVLCTFWETRIDFWFGK